MNNVIPAQAGIQRNNVIPACAGMTLALALGACASMKRVPSDEPGAPPSVSEQAVSACNFTSHLKCIYLTGQETFSDGMDLQWTRHWFRMSYIGRACEREYGRTTAVVLESVFAPVHYLWIGIGNTLGVVLSPLRRPDRSEEPPAEARHPGDSRGL